MERVRIIYSKSKEAIYFEHKDLICIFENSLKRSGVEINYKNGMPNFTFAYPLDIGIESTYEIIDAVIEDMVPLSFFIKELNNKLPPGIACLYADYIGINAKSIESSVFASVYIINFIYDDNELKNMTNAEITNMKNENINSFKNFLEQSQINVLKKSSERSERINIKNRIQDYSVLIDGSFEITADTGERVNLNIMDLVSGFKEYVGKDIDLNIKRIKILYK